MRQRETERARARARVCIRQRACKRPIEQAIQSQGDSHRKRKSAHAVNERNKRSMAATGRESDRKGEREGESERESERARARASARLIVRAIQRPGNSQRERRESARAVSERSMAATGGESERERESERECVCCVRMRKCACVRMRKCVCARVRASVSVRALAWRGVERARRRRHNAASYSCSHGYATPDGAGCGVAEKAAPHTRTC